MALTVPSTITVGTRYKVMFVQAIQRYLNSNLLLYLFLLKKCSRYHYDLWWIKALSRSLLVLEASPPPPSFLSSLHLFYADAHFIFCHCEVLEMSSV